MNKLERYIEEERKSCECAKRLGYSEDGDYISTDCCEGCRNYDKEYLKCDIYENVRVALEEDAEYDRLGLDDYS